jgi:molybdopterin synthase sulfur carrier subunit
VVKVILTPVLVRDLKIEKHLDVSATTIKELLSSIDKSTPGFKDSICDENWDIRKYVNVFVNGENIKESANPMDGGLRDGDEVYILASVAGGEV